MCMPQTTCMAKWKYAYILTSRAGLPGGPLLYRQWSLNEYLYLCINCAAEARYHCHRQPLVRHNGDGNAEQSKISTNSPSHEDLDGLIHLKVLKKIV